MSTSTSQFSFDDQLPPARRLHVLKAIEPSLVIEDRVIAASLQDVWRMASDLETMLPAIGGNFVQEFTIVDRSDAQMIASVSGLFGVRDTFEIDLRHGWCWMEGRVLQAAMAAEETEGGTRFYWAARIKMPGFGIFAPVTANVLRRTLDSLNEFTMHRLRS